MEVCGTHTAAIFKNGIRSFLSPKIKLVSGPGCPVCVTIPSYIDHCIEICQRPDQELLCFGDLLKVPGTEKTLSDAKGRIRMIWSPFDAIDLAEKDPDTVFVVAAIGFETTIPAFALLIEEAKARGLHNIKLFTSLKSAIKAIGWICAVGEDIDAFLCPGHVSVITGSDAYIPLAEKYKKPFIVAGFEGEHLLKAICAAAEGVVGVQNFYPEAVSPEGNIKAREITDKLFVTGDAVWRGLGTVPDSGYYLREEYQSFEFEVMSPCQMTKEPSPCHMTKEPSPCHAEPSGCRCGDVILGRIDPDECPLFGKTCTPMSAVGPCMVSSEGACGTWYKSSF